MREGFAGVVAVPAWGRFMRAATSGAPADWYPVPPGVEKIAICRLSGERATDACRHQIEYSMTAAADVPSYDQAYGVIPASAPRRSAPGETPVYEDYFPIGSVPDELCPLHNTTPLEAAAVATPTVDSILRGSVGTSGTPPDQGSRIVIERVLGPDGVMRVIMRQVKR